MFNFLFKRIDNSPLIAFRILFGLLMLFQVYISLSSNWIPRAYTDPKFTFSHIGMEWLQPLPGNGMYWYYAVMGVFALTIAIGFKYRASLVIFGLMWAGTYYMQKTIYNNHHYLMILFCIIMLFLPANAYASVDSRRNPAIRRYSMPYWCIGVIIAQMAIVYFFAAVAKLYPGWLDGTFTRIMLPKGGTHWYTRMLTQEWCSYLIAYAGIAFDLLIIPMLLYKRTRHIGAVASLGFHLFNSALLKIGIFPYLALALLVMFYPPEQIRRLFFWKKPPVVDDGSLIKSPKNNKLLLYFFVPYFIIQLALPVRHYFIPGDVMWTEEGHRLSWRMMLKFKTGKVDFRIVDRKTGEVFGYDLKNTLTPKQISSMSTRPDMIWQMAQYIKKEYAAKGRDVAIYANAMVSLNNSPRRPIIDTDTDLTRVEWKHLTHNEWILLNDK